MRDQEGAERYTIIQSRTFSSNSLRHEGARGNIYGLKGGMVV